MQENLLGTPLTLAEELRQVVSTFVRLVRVATDTVRNSQHETLELLETHGPLSIADLARLRGVKHQSMRLVINELEQQGNVLRQKNVLDSRALLMVLSEAGSQQLMAARARRASWIANEITSKLDEQAQQDLKKGLEALRKLL
ncbi:MarR family winged helix-turn-helix transcriptional regulator [Pantoea sp.]|uniref:MarR family winged helix-turn-helix transcriptional regulator n=1 Tax=Pantoea sp. TaxID=69393 RepID=UPI0028ADFA81|nr:MarR family transcriptional regulator [Pantoea sp.]